MRARGARGPDLVHSNSGRSTGGPRDLPVFAELRVAIEKHNGALKGVRWKLLGYHVQGGVVASDVKPK